MTCSMPRMSPSLNRDSLKRAKAEPIVARERGRILWEIDVESPSMPPEVGHKYEPDDVFCYIETQWNTYDKVLANFSGNH